MELCDIAFHLFHPLSCVEANLTTDMGDYKVTQVGRSVFMQIHPHSLADVLYGMGGAGAFLRLTYYHTALWHCERVHTCVHSLSLLQ